MSTWLARSFDCARRLAPLRMTNEETTLNKGGSLHPQLATRNSQLATRNPQPATRPSRIRHRQRLVVNDRRRDHVRQPAFSRSRRCCSPAAAHPRPQRSCPPSQPDRSSAARGGGPARVAAAVRRPRADSSCRNPNPRAGRTASCTPPPQPPASCAPAVHCAIPPGSAPAAHRRAHGHCPRA